MAAINEEMVSIENRARVKSDGLSAQTPMRQRRKLGDSSNLFNNGATPLSSKNAASYKTPAPFSVKETAAQNLPRLINQIEKSAPANNFLNFGKEVHLRPDNQLSEFLESKYSVDLEKPEPIFEEEEMIDLPNDNLDISLEPNIDVSFLAGSPTIDEVFELSIADKMVELEGEFAHETEIFGKTDRSFENWLSGQYDVDLGKGEFHIAPGSPLETDDLNSFDRSFELYVSSLNNEVGSINEAIIEMDEDLENINPMSDLEEKLLSVDIDELLNL